MGMILRYTVPNVNGPNDCLRCRMTDDLDSLSLWWTNNRLPLNVAKWWVVSCTLKAEVITFGYSIDDVVLQRADYFLGVTIYVKFSFSNHIQRIITEPMKTYEFLSWKGREFGNINTLKVLFNAFVKSQLEYASIVWSPNYNVHFDSVEAGKVNSGNS